MLFKLALFSINTRQADSPNDKISALRLINSAFLALSSLTISSTGSDKGIHKINIVAPVDWYQFSRRWQYLPDTPKYLQIDFLSKWMKHWTQNTHWISKLVIFNVLRRIYSSKVPCLGWALLNPAVSGYGRLPQQVKQVGIYPQEIFGKVVRWLSQVNINAVS